MRFKNAMLSLRGLFPENIADEGAIRAIILGKFAIATTGGYAPINCLDVGTFSSRQMRRRTGAIYSALVVFLYKS